MSDVHELWPAINFDPTYQRQSDVWGDAKKQLFIDSLINGYDIPKLYFHDLSWNARAASDRFAIIDGKQRLEAIHGFIEGDFALSDEFEDIEVTTPAGNGSPAGLSYSQLASTRPDLKARFDNAELPVVLVETKDPEIIDEMFSRLNEAVPLNAPEKRNALGGPLPSQIRRLVKHPFFLKKLAFPNARYRHLDLATKFLYMEYRDGLTDLKKKDLDGFVKYFRQHRMKARSAELFRASSANLDRMALVFKDTDRLLDSVGMITIYYHLFRTASDKSLPRITRSLLENFDDERVRNRNLVKERQELALEGKELPAAKEISAVLVAFERFVQSPNDVAALRQRYAVLSSYLQKGTLPKS